MSLSPTCSGFAAEVSEWFLSTVSKQVLATHPTGQHQRQGGGERGVGLAPGSEGAEPLLAWP